MEGEAQREIQRLVENLKPEDRELLRAMSESELIRLHRSYGMWLRNQFRRNNLPHLFKFCSTNTLPGARSFDAFSEVAIREIWLHIRSNPKEQLCAPERD